MHPGVLARADQIVAVIREADGPLPTPELYRRLGPPFLNRWNYEQTLALLQQLYATDRLDVAKPSCCGHHALWVLPADD